jgi:hypothetical protein
MSKVMSATYGKFSATASNGVFLGCNYAAGTAAEHASRVAMLDRLDNDERVMPDKSSADKLKEWCSEKMEQCKEQLKCAISDPGAGLRGITSAGAIVTTCDPIVYYPTIYSLAVLELLNHRPLYPACAGTLAA